MRTRAYFSLLPLLLLSAQHVEAQDPTPILAVIVHRDSPIRELKRAQLAAIFTSSRQTWDNGAQVLAFALPPENRLRQLFDQAVLGMTPHQVGQFWVDQRVRGGPRPPRIVSNPALVVKVVARFNTAVSYVPASAVDSTVRVVARIRNGTVIPPTSARAGQI